MAVNPKKLICIKILRNEDVVIKCLLNCYVVFKVVYWLYGTLIKIATTSSEEEYNSPMASLTHSQMA